jgi:hypothetical protein
MHEGMIRKMVLRAELHDRRLARLLEFDSGVIGRELPVGFGVMGIAISLPCGDLVDKDFLVGDAAVEACDARTARSDRSQPA